MKALGTTKSSMSFAARDARPLELLKRLLRFDTSNPPGGERECALYLEKLLRGAGLETTMLGRLQDRPNLIARMMGRGQAPPLLLNGHMDVAPVTGQVWTHPPFAAEVHDGFLWGRGALDDKAGIAMMAAALLRARDQGMVPAGDVVFAALADEECSSSLGAEYLVEVHPHLFAGIRYALSEFGGFALWQGRTRFYPIQVAEKQTGFVRAVFRGAGGHSSSPERGGALAQLGRALAVLDQKRLPVHISRPTRLMIEAMARSLPFPRGFVLRRILNPWFTDSILAASGGRRAALEPFFHNTVTPTRVSASEQINIVPSEARLEMQARILPGFGPEDLRAELRALLGDKVELELSGFQQGPLDPDMGLFDLLGGVLKELDPGGTPAPLMLSGATDARFFARLGIQTYGFTPMRLPRGFEFWRQIHGPDERIPLEALDFGTDAIYRVLERYGAPYS